MDNELIQVALGQKPADIVIKNGKLVNVITHEVYETEIAIANGKIASIGPVPAGAVGPDTQVIDAKGMYLAPGFMDAHIHIESSMLSYTEFAKMVVKHGTTAVATDLMEVTIVSGVEGMKEVLAESKNTPVKLYYPVPAFMEENGLQTSGSWISCRRPWAWQRCWHPPFWPVLPPLPICWSWPRSTTRPPRAMPPPSWARP